jgi:methyl-accepting chemotaxis protein
MSSGDLTGEINLKTSDEIEEIGLTLNNFRIRISETLGIIKCNVEDVQRERCGSYEHRKRK